VTNEPVGQFPAAEPFGEPFVPYPSLYLRYQLIKIARRVLRARADFGPVGSAYRAAPPEQDRQAVS
jgi:hypothetical protein